MSLCFIVYCIAYYRVRLYICRIVLSWSANPAKRNFPALKRDCDLSAHLDYVISYAYHSYITVWPLFKIELGIHKTLLIFALRAPNPFLRVAVDSTTWFPQIRSLNEPLWAAASSGRNARDAIWSHIESLTTKEGCFKYFMFLLLLLFYCILV